MPAKTKKQKTKSKPKETYYKYFIHYIYCLAVILFLTIASFNINKYFESQKVLGASVDATNLLSEKEYWTRIIASAPTYVDGYLQIAKIDMELGNKTEALNLIKIALSLDPNSTKIPEVQRELGI